MISMILLAAIEDFMALKPASYFMRLFIASLAFAAAMNAQGVITRVLGFTWLLIAGASLLLVGISHGTIVDILLGIVAIAAMGYSWWYTRI